MLWWNHELCDKKSYIRMRRTGKGENKNEKICHSRTVVKPLFIIYHIYEYGKPVKLLEYRN